MLHAQRQEADVGAGQRLQRDLGLPRYDGTLFEGPPSATHRMALFSRHLLRVQETTAPTSAAGLHQRERRAT